MIGDSTPRPTPAMPLKEDVSVDNDVFDDAVETFTHPAKESPGSVVAPPPALFAAVNAFSNGSAKPLVNGAGASSSQTSGSLKLDGFSLDSSPAFDEDVTPTTLKFKPKLHKVTSNVSVGSAATGASKMKSAGKAVIAAQTMISKGGKKKTTAVAQAMTRLTGTIFDSDDQIPTYLHTPITSIVGASDAVRNTVQTYRRMIEGLMYWESLTSSLYISFGLFWAYILGRFGFSIAWALLLMVFVGNAFARNLSAIRRHVAFETTRNLAIRRLENESETVEWLNKFVQRLWTQMEPGLSASLKASLEPSLGSSMSMPVFTLGSAAPRIETIRTIAKTSDDVHLMDWDLNFTPVDEDDFSKREKELGEIRSSRIEVKYNMIPILIANIEFSGKLRVGIKYMTKHPHIKLIEYSFLEPPVVNFKLRPLKGIDLMDSGLSGLVAGIINSSLAGYVEPNKNIFDMEAFFEGTSSDVPVGVLKITIFEAKDLKNVELGGVSDPYAKIVIGDKEVARTSDISQSLSPYWGETYYIAVMKSHLEIPPDLPPNARRPDMLKIQIMDKNEALNDKSMGFTESLPLAQWIRLLESDSSRLKNKASAVSITNSGDPMDIRGKVSGDKPLSKVDRNRLLTEWGTPFPEDSDVWKHVMHEEGGKPRGEVRVDLSYYPLPKTTETIEAPTPTASTVDEDPAAVKAREAAQAEATKIREEAAKARAEAEAKLTTGVLTITIHQAKELPCSKSANPTCSLAINGLARPPVSPSNVLGSTPAAKKTNNPVWDHTFVYYVADSNAAELNFAVKDEGRYLGTVAVPVKDLIQKKPPGNESDWYKLSAATGKLRVTCKWQPLDLENCHKNADVVRKEPIGMIRINLIEAKGVANVEAFRKSDPYAKLHLSRRPIGATHVKENTLDPTWNEVFHAVCYSRNEPIRIELWDYNKVKKDLGLGRVEFHLEELLNPASWDHVAEDVADREKRIAEEGEEEEDEEDMHDEKEEVDLKRQAYLLKQKTDGLRVVKKGNIMDVWAPIYIVRNQDETEDSTSKDPQGSRTLAGPPLLTASTTALNMVGIGAGAKAGQKGHLHLEIEMLEVVGEHYVRPKTEEELKALSKLHDEAEDAERERISREGETPVVVEAPETKTEKALKGMVSLSELLKGPATDATHKLLLNYEPPVEVLKSYPAGIVRLRVHELRGLENPANYYAELLVDDEVSGQTRVQRRMKDPIWDAAFDVFFKNVAKQQAKVLVRTAGDDLKRQSNDPIVAVWTADILEVAGRRNVWVPLHPNGWEGNVGELRVSVGYAPIQMEADEDSSKSMGVLYADIVDAVHLEAVDSSGTSDPYCIIALNDKPIHKTKVHKKQVSPTFNETVTANIRSRLRSTLAITVRDHNAIGKHTTLGTVSLQLSKIAPDALYVALLPLEGARGGFIRLRVLFVPQVLDESAFDDDVAAGDKKEDGRLAKFTKGLGSSAVGAITSSVEHLGGKAIPKQEQSGLTAEDIAKGRNAPIRSLGDAAGSPEPSDRPSSPIELARSLSANQSLQALIEERQRQQLYGTVVLTIEAARNLKPVDVGGTSDPYIKVVQLVHGKEKVLHKTRVVKKTLDPVWAHEAVTIRVPPNTVRIIMKDKNMFAESKPMGEIDLDLSTLLQQSKTSFDVWMPLGLGGMGEVRLTGVYRPEGVSRSASTASVALKVPAIHTDDEEESRPLSPAMSASSSRSSLYDGASINGGAPSIPKERKRLFSFGKKP